MSGCQEIRRILPAFVALELEAAGEDVVRRHLAGCEECRDALAELEPASALALRLGAVETPEDSGFVGEVLAGVHQRRVERRLGHRRGRWLGVAAALALAVLGGWAVLRHPGSSSQDVVAVRPRPAVTSVEPAFVEVEGEGVRLYQLDASSHEAVQVAFIVDPHLEL